MKPRTLIIVPAHNEADALPAVIADLERHAPFADVVIVDDGSTDNTANVARGLGARVLRLPLNLGIGGAVQTGFRLAERLGYDCAVQFDGDGQHRADAVDELVAPVARGDADAAIGSRFLAGDGFQSTFARRFGIALFRLLVRVTTGRTFTDCTSGFRAYNRPAIEFLAESYSSDYPEVESIITLSRNRFRLVEVPVRMRERQGGRSSITLVRSLYYMVKVALASLISNVKPVRRGPMG